MFLARQEFGHWVGSTDLATLVFTREVLEGREPPVSL